MKLIPKWKAGIPMVKFEIRSKADRRSALLDDPDVVKLLEIAWQDGLLRLNQTFKEFLTELKR